jgi:hypothetical protein
MNHNDLENIKLHIAGATVRNTPPFDNLKPFKNSFELSKDFIDKWVIPFYMKIGSTDSDWLNQLTILKSEITTDIIEKNLGDFNWRTRQIGAFFSAITNQTQYIDIIGMHLLKSEVCYAGSVYCQVLASFNLPKCVDYLNIYLDYYLTKPDLWFDQRDALEAICYLDKLNSTNYFDKHLENWGEFLKNKPHWEKEISTDKLENQINFIESIRKFAG